MGYALSMSGEIREWLASLNASDPHEAMVVGQALVALVDAGPDLGPPVVVALDSRPFARTWPRLWTTRTRAGSNASRPSAAPWRM